MTPLVTSPREAEVLRVLADTRRRLRMIASGTEDRETRGELLELADDLEAVSPRRRPFETGIPRMRLEAQV